MLFQALDDKKECIGVFAEGELCFDELPQDLTHTWDFSSSIDREGIQFAKIYANGKELGEVCPEHLQEDFQRVHKKMIAFYKSFQLSGVSLQEHCFFDLVPQRHLLEYCSIKNEISEWVFQNYEKPPNHDFLVKATRMVKSIAQQHFSVDKSELNRYNAEERVRHFRQRLGNNLQRVSYNPFGTITGRLTASKASFPILTLDKKFRNIIKPKNDWLVELDFNAAELRTLLGLSGTPQPEEDLHLWNMENIYDEDITREQAKEKIFSWLYNPNALDKKAENYYSRDKLVEEYYTDGKIKTPMGRTIESPDRKALNYLIQSTSSDIFLNSAYNIWEMLENKKSEVRFLVHDSVLLDLSDEDKALLPEMIDKFSKTPLGKYKVGVSIGKSYGEMRKMK
tara:strand:- start:2407 stop:3591 length:1185 start_codon:yes stop_codon:yes gene_type:complete